MSRDTPAHIQKRAAQPRKNRPARQTKKSCQPIGKILSSCLGGRLTRPSGRSPGSATTLRSGLWPSRERVAPEQGHTVPGDRVTRLPAVCRTVVSAERYDAADGSTQSRQGADGVAFRQLRRLGEHRPDPFGIDRVRASRPSEVMTPGFMLGALSAGVSRAWGWLLGVEVREAGPVPPRTAQRASDGSR